MTRRAMLEVGREAAGNNAGSIDRSQCGDPGDRNEKRSRQEEPLHAARSSHGEGHAQRR
jgi:hypothetical protein